MKSLFILCLSLVPFIGEICLPDPIEAADAPLVAVDVSNLAEGESLIVTKKGGVISTRPLTLLVPGTTTPTGPTNPPTGSPFAQVVQVLTKEALNNQGTKTTGAALSSVYSLVADGIADGSIDTKNAQAMVQAGTTLVLSRQADKAAWEPWRLSLGGALDKLIQDGSLSTKAQFISTFRDIASGMNQATGYTAEAQTKVLARDPAAGILEGLDLAKIIELIKLIMELFKLFKPV